jgi:hypothetical protein
MKIRNIIVILFFIPAFCLALISCKDRSSTNLLLITRVPGNIQKTDFTDGDSWRNVKGAQIMAVNPDKPGKAKILTGDFYSACFPEVSYDGRYMIFSAKQNENDPWQVYEMEISKGKARKITSTKADCYDPVYLPAGRMAFTRYTANDTVKSAQCIYTGNIDGTNIRQITFGPFENFATAVLKDGRLLTVSRRLLPEAADQMLTVMRPDGTKADIYYKGITGSKLLSRPRETNDGKIMFIETSGGDTSDWDLVSITYNRPLHSRVDLTSGIAGDFNSVLPMLSGKILVSYRKPESDHFILYEFDPGEKSLGKVVYDSRENSVLDVNIAMKYTRPRKLPSEVDKGVKTGLLLCQDVNFTGFISSDNRVSPKVAMIEFMGMDSSYGAVPVEKDGSVYLKILADKPFQMRTLDDKGNVISGTCTWLWLRPNERRGCVGCHEDPETVPKNRIPEAVKKEPFIIPVHVIKIKEKTVELE